jgi:plastocyanin
MHKKHSFAAVASFMVAMGSAGAAVTAAAEHEAAAEPQTFNVTIDGQVDEFNASFFGYYPDHVTAHPGDTVVFTSVFTGEPHSITFGSIIQSVAEGFLALTPEQQSGEAPPPPELDAAFAQIPPMLPEGEGDAIQTSVNACFVPEGGEVPTDPATMCEVTTPSPFTGTEVFYNSGFVPDAMTFEMRLADDLAPGTYYGFCTLHFVEMIFRLDVVDPEVPTATPDEVAAEGLEQLEADTAEALPALEEANAMTAEMPGHILAGTGAPDSNVLITEFLPNDATVAAGEPVTWTINGPHTVTFNAPESARTLLAQGEDGGYHLNPEGLTPAGFEMAAPPGGSTPPEGSMAHEGTAPAEGTEPAEGSVPAEGPPVEEAPPPPVNAGTWNGEGFFNSGFMFGGDFTVTFSEPGTYQYDCLIHPEMQGTITVT